MLSVKGFLRKVIYFLKLPRNAEQVLEKICWLDTDGQKSIIIFYQEPPPQTSLFFFRKKYASPVGAVAFFLR